MEFFFFYSFSLISPDVTKEEEEKKEISKSKNQKKISHL
jgi:hypothetical protein